MPRAALKYGADPVVVIIRHGKTEYNKLGIFTGPDKRERTSAVKIIGETIEVKHSIHTAIVPSITLPSHILPYLTFPCFTLPHHFCPCLALPCIPYYTVHYLAIRLARCELDSRGESGSRSCW